MRPGMLTSVNTTSTGSPARRTACASSAVEASSTRKPFWRRKSATARRVRTSSSTTRTVDLLFAPLPDLGVDGPESAWPDELLSDTRLSAGRILQCPPNKEPEQRAEKREPVF